ncbi:MAG: histidine phosphatase family protein [Anaerolineales bacterium]|nr:histidine phosphatase family protein [Anaerolineales bacterium]
MRIYFARHGHSHANLLRKISNRGLCHGLTPAGREQAVKLAQRLQHFPIIQIYSSPVLRAIETSIILANQLQVEYEITDALREFDCGILEGRSDEEAWRGWQEISDAWLVHKCWDQRIEGGESYNDLRERFVPFIECLVNRFGGTQAEVVSVSHGGLYRMMLPLVLKDLDADRVFHQGFGYTACLVAESHPQGLFFTQLLEGNNPR